MNPSTFILVTSFIIFAVVSNSIRINLHYRTQIIKGFETKYSIYTPELVEEATSAIAGTTGVKLRLLLPLTDLLNHQVVPDSSLDFEDDSSGSLFSTLSRLQEGTNSSYFLFYFI